MLPTAQRNAQSDTTSQQDKEFAVSPPAINLPKGGGAIRGMGEKFAANPVTGTGSMSVPIATSPGRSGFGPQLSLSYDSGSGNGPFGFGWNLSIPSVTRKTDKGLPKYWDAEDSDVFILSGAEDLVPVLVEVDGQWVPQTLPLRTLGGKEYEVRRYRPRIEGLFARIERWTNRHKPEDTFWRSISKDNITTWYGKTIESRIADPADASRIFSWLICQSYDDKGNAIVYKYTEENDDNVARTQASERNRERKGNRYLKSIKYGNRQPNRNESWQATDPVLLPNETWMFEVLLDYDEGHYEDLDLDPAQPAEAQHQFVRASVLSEQPWSVRQDPFSSYRSSFEVRTHRLCRRTLMFHHFPEELGINDCLVRSTEFSYEEGPIASFITSVSQSGFVRQPADGQSNRYLKKSLPPVEFEYSKAPSPEELARQPIREVKTESLENLPIGLDGAIYQSIDLDGEGTNGILTEQGSRWYYKRNLSANNLIREDGHERTEARFGPVELIASQPAASLGNAQFLDLAGDGQVDLVQMDGAARGFYERTDDANWAPFQPFGSWADVNTHDPNLRFVDLTGDGHADILITESDALTWYPSLAEEGFGPCVRVSLPLDEEKGPRLIFADSEQSIYLADLSGDGLSDLVRIRNGEVCYWPNLGYGQFGARVTTDDAPWFDAHDQFDQRRIRLADIDGSGVTDILYLRRDGVQIYFNQSGNSWSGVAPLPQFPPIDNISAVQVLDLLGNGTACLVWSSPLPNVTRSPMRYLALMEQKPHLLVGTKNNLGAETKVHYAPSTKFYLDDKRAGKLWITRLPFPVHVVERVEVYDHISRNRFMTRYTYHHGYFDGAEREFRGFGMVEQLDTEEFSVLSESGALTGSTNLDGASHVPPVLTKTWFHTGVYLGRDHISNFFVGFVDADDQGEYYREPGLDDVQARTLLLPDTILPDGWTAEEEREACRALKGSTLRQEVYALDHTDKAIHPYSVAEQNFSIKQLQPTGDNKFAVFFTHAREAISYHYERNPKDPRIQHALTLDVDKCGNIWKQAAIGYGRRQPDAGLSDEDQKKQTQILITYTENRFTQSVDEADNYRTPLPVESRTYELTGVQPADEAARFSFNEWTRDNFNLPVSAGEIFYEQLANHTNPQKRLIEYVRTLYRKDDLTALLQLGELESLALPGESYKLAFTPGLLAQVYLRGGGNLLPDLAGVIPIDAPNNQASDRGGYVDLDNNGHWWIPSGQVFFSSNTEDSPAQEFSFACENFFLPHRYRDPFHTDAVHTESTVTYDDHKLLMKGTLDPLGNTVQAQNDYRVLAAHLMTDPNGNRSEAAFDGLGLVAGMAVMGKQNEPDGRPKGDSLEGFTPDLTQADLNAFIAQPRQPSADPDKSEATAVVHNLLKDATTRIVYDLGRFHRLGEPPFAATIACETHLHDLDDGERSRVQVSFSYSDGFGREIQKKIQAEPGPLIEGGPKVNPRWVGSGWTVFNNKGKPVRQYEPFFDETHRFKFAKIVGVSPIVFYDPLERVVATLHPNHTWEKVVFGPWGQTTLDVNDTVTINPGTDNDVKGFFINPDGTPRIPSSEYLPTWYELRNDPLHATEFAAHYPDVADRSNETSAADKAAAHADTPTTVYFDTLGRPFLTVAHNKVVCRDHALDGTEAEFQTRTELDIEGNQRAVTDARDRIVMRYDYDMLGNRIHQSSMEAGERWMLNDVTGKPIRAWDSRDHEFRTSYDRLRRPVESFLKEGAEPEIQTGRIIYGEGMGSAGNHRTRVFQVFDSAGIVTSEAYDFKGNLEQSKRDLLPDYKSNVDWKNSPVPGDGSFTSSTEYDALNRPVAATAPDGSMYRPTYNEANLLNKVDVNLRGATAVTHFVTNIDYDAKGQRKLVAHANGATTKYDYDTFTFRLVHLLTTRPAGRNGLASQLFVNTSIMQDLHYTYDPVGNITNIRDSALPTIPHDGQIVDPSADYIYDAIYRLIFAHGREHIGQSAFDLHPPDGNYRDYPFMGQRAPASDPQALRNYREYYVYDAVGNFELLRHSANGGSWTQTYDYQEDSLIEPAKKSNRLTRTTIGNGLAHTAEYFHDVHGNMTGMPHLPIMEWDFKDQLRASQQQNVATDGTGEKTYYVYDALGQRVRKVTERQNGTRKHERIYLGGFEIYREYNGTGATTPRLERESLHIMDDKQRIALVETRTQGSDPGPEQLIRYQFGNHLGSAVLELDNVGEVITYEEYYPYGSTSYQAGNKEIKAAAKRYRYTDKERDEESGFYYYGLRYYISWLGRWVSCDPANELDGVNLFQFVEANPIRLIDKKGLADVPFNFEEESMQVRENGKLIFVNEMKPVDYHGPAPNGYGYYRSEFDLKTNTFLGTGDSGLKIESHGELKSRGIAGALRAEHFEKYLKTAGQTPAGFDIQVVEPRSVEVFSNGGSLERSWLGRHLEKAGNAVGITVDQRSVIIEKFKDGFRVRGNFIPKGPNIPIGTALTAAGDTLPASEKATVGLGIGLKSSLALRFFSGLGVGIATNWVATKIARTSDMPLSEKEREEMELILAVYPPGVNIGMAAYNRVLVEPAAKKFSEVAYQWLTEIGAIPSVLRGAPPSPSY